MRLNELAQMMRIAGDESRLRILCVIFKDPKICVSKIAKQLDQSVAIVSHHLGVMARKGLVEPVREGKNICYRVSDKKAVLDLKKFICKYKN
jgi:ArsR family transcriptional regulator